MLIDCFYQSANAQKGKLTNIQEFQLHSSFDTTRALTF